MKSGKEGDGDPTLIAEHGVGEKSVVAEVGGGKPKLKQGYQFVVGGSFVTGAGTLASLRGVGA